MFSVLIAGVGSSILTPSLFAISILSCRRVVDIGTGFPSLKSEIVARFVPAAADLGVIILTAIESAGVPSVVMDCESEAVGPTAAPAQLEGGCGFCAGC